MHTQTRCWLGMTILTSILVCIVELLLFSLRTRNVRLESAIQIAGRFPPLFTTRASCKVRDNDDFFTKVSLFYAACCASRDAPARFHIQAPPTTWLAFFFYRSLQHTYVCIACGSLQTTFAETVRTRAANNRV